MINLVNYIENLGTIGKMAEKYTIIRTSRYGNVGEANIRQLASVMRRDIKRLDDLVRVCNEAAEKEKAATNEVIIYDLYHVKEDGESNIVHTIEVEGKKSI